MLALPQKKKLTYITLLDTLLISNITTVDTKHVTHDCVQLIPDAHTQERIQVHGNRCWLLALAQPQYGCLSAVPSCCNSQTVLQVLQL